MGDEIIIKYVPEIPELDKVLSEEELEFVLGDGDVVQGKQPKFVLDLGDVA